MLPKAAKGHPRVSDLKRYSSGVLGIVLATDTERHLDQCRFCRIVVDKMNTAPLSAVHMTTFGPVKLWVRYRLTKALVRVSGPGMDFKTTCESVEEANGLARSAFLKLCSDHQCSAQCRLGKMASGYF